MLGTVVTGSHPAQHAGGGGGRAAPSADASFGTVIPTRALSRFDVAVVGAGVIGLSIAWHLAERGFGVAMVERTGIAAGASGVQPGGVRLQWATRANCLLAKESLSFYRGLSERLGTRLRPSFSPCGYAFLAHSEGRLAELAAAVELQHELGIPSRLLAPGDVSSVVPELDATAIVGASWCGEDGYFDRAQEPVEAFAEAAEARGAELVRAEVTGLEADGGGWLLLGPGTDGLRAEHVVVAAGCESVPILESVGLRLPIEPEQRFLFLSDPVGERLLEPLVVATEIAFAAKQLADGRVLASDLRAQGSPGTDAPSWRRTVRDGIEQLLPRLQAVSFRHLVPGVYDVTPDHDPVLGAAPGVDGVWVAAGFSGHGFMLAPAVGRLLAGAVAGGAPDPLLAGFRAERFAGGPRDAETQIV
jgi:glycine/D-amino acid oxidase-like deaminating enzyme